MAYKRRYSKSRSGNKKTRGKKQYKPRYSGSKKSYSGSKGSDTEKRTTKNYGSVSWKKPEGYLIIAEKPSVAKRFRDAFGLKQSLRHRGKIPYFKGVYKGRNITVVPLAGHVLEIKFPNKPFKVIPVYPEDIEFEPAKGKTAFLELLKKEMSDRYVVFATDYDREGELISYEVYKYFNVPEERHYRMHFSALTKEDIINSFEEALKENEKIDFNLAHAGLVRAYLDKLYGFNITRLISRAVTEEEGKFNLWSAGRVQTPTLRLILEREEAIRNFIKRPTIKIVMEGFIDGVKATFESAPVIVDEEHAEEISKFLETINALGYEAVVNGKKASVNDVLKDPKKLSVRKIKDATVGVKLEKKEVSERPPIPLDTTRALSMLSSKLRIKTNEASKILQTLYENAKITYPRTDSNKFDNNKYPPSYHRALLKKLSQSYPVAKESVSGRPRSAGKKLDPAHPPIHPKGTPDGLTGNYYSAYDLIAKHYIALFLPDFKKEVLIMTTRTPLSLVSKFERVIDEGWKKVFGDVSSGEIPDIRSRKVHVGDVSIMHGETKPPARYSTATIIGKMEAVNIGTKSTRPEILNTLESRKYIVVRKNTIYITDKGEQLIKIFDRMEDGKVKELSTIDFTARLEDDMSKVERGELDYKKIINENKELIKKLSDDDVEKVKEAYRSL